ncbi:MAG TPA: hypothetical protein VM618_06285 [Acidimicrobiia bacterium]|nr:hypothetical protein [Acidimicrobiia bacterium]
MKKAIITLGVAGLVSAGAWLMPAGAETVETPAGSLTVDESGVVADGVESNPDPLDGYLTVTEEGVCGQDQGAPDDEDANPSCNEALITGQIPA